MTVSALGIHIIDFDSPGIMCMYILIPCVSGVCVCVVCKIHSVCLTSLFPLLLCNPSTVVVEVCRCVYIKINVLRPMILSR